MEGQQKKLQRSALLLRLTTEGSTSDSNKRMEHPDSGGGGSLVEAKCAVKGNPSLGGKWAVMDERRPSAAAPVQGNPSLEAKLAAMDERRRPSAAAPVQENSSLGGKRAVMDERRPSTAANSVRGNPSLEGKWAVMDVRAPLGGDSVADD